MIIVGGFSWIGTILLLTFPVLAIRDIIRAIRKFKQHRQTERLIRETEALQAEVQDDIQRFDQWQKEYDRRKKEHKERLRELEAAVDAASDPEERKAAWERVYAECNRIWWRW